MKSKWQLFIIFVVVLILQVTVISRMDIFGVHPNITIPLIVVVAIFEGSETGSFFGLILGLMQEILFSKWLGIRALLYFLIGYFVGEKGRKISANRLSPILYMTCAATVASFLGSYIILAYLGESVHMMGYLRGPIILELIWNCLMVLVLNYIYSKGKKKKNYYGF